MTSSNGTEGAASAAPVVVIPEGASVAQIDRAEQQAYERIENVQDPDQAEQLLREVTLADQAVRILRISKDREQRWGGLRLRAERRYGQLLGPAKVGTNRFSVSGTHARTDTERFASKAARQVAAVPEAKFDAYLENSSKPTRTGLLREAAAGAPRSRQKTNTIPPPEAYDRLRARAKEVRSLPSNQRPRWTETDVDLVDAALAQKRRPKYAGRRLRELGGKRRNGHELANLQYRMMQLVGILESVDVADYELGDADDVSQFHDDLVALQLWMDRSIALASARLDDAGLERKIRKLRDHTGRPEPERRTAEALANKLEQRRRGNQIAG